MWRQFTVLYRRNASESSNVNSLKGGKSSEFRRTCADVTIRFTRLYFRSAVIRCCRALLWMPLALSSSFIKWKAQITRCCLFSGCASLRSAITYQAGAGCGFYSSHARDAANRDCAYRTFVISLFPPLGSVAYHLIITRFELQKGKSLMHAVLI